MANTHKQGPAWKHLQKWGYMKKRICTTKMGGAAAIMHDGTARGCGAFFNHINELKTWNHLKEIACTTLGVIGLRFDGHVYSTEPLFADWAPHVGTPVSEWPANIKSISANWGFDDHVLGLTADGHVLAYGSNNRGQCNVGNWSDITEILAGIEYSVGLRKDGTVVVCGNDTLSEKVSAWQNVEHIFCCGKKTQQTVIGLTADGRVLVASEQSIFNTSLWNDIIDIACTDDTIAGLKGNGDALFTGNVPYGFKLNHILSVQMTHNGGETIISAITTSGTTWWGGAFDLTEKQSNVLETYSCSFFTLMLQFAGSFFVLAFKDEDRERYSEQIADWQIFTGIFEPEQSAPVQSNVPASTTGSTQNTPSDSSAKDKNTYLLAAILFLFIFWPVSIYFFYKYSQC